MKLYWIVVNTTLDGDIPDEIKFAGLTIKKNIPVLVESERDIETEVHKAFPNEELVAGVQVDPVAEFNLQGDKIVIQKL